MKRLGQYELVERIGVGGMAEVFLARAERQGGFSQTCVIKVLHKELAENQNFTRHLLEEARLIAQLRHNNIASLIDVGREDGTLFLVMEYIDGRDLHQILSTAVRKRKSLPIAFAVHVATQLCRGLHFAHTRRDDNGNPLHLVHRDVSPQNVLVSMLGEVKLIDFGVAKFKSDLREKTRAGVIKGKFGYMSPEQAFDEPLDGRSDLFSVGICLYEMLTGRSLYGQSDDPVKMLRRAREAAAEPITKLRPDVPKELANHVHRALSKGREARFQTAYELEQALARFQAGHTPGYTNLDAGMVLKELFDSNDPALDGVGQSSPPPVKKVPVPEEATHPMRDVPEELRHSGSFSSQNRVEVTIDPDEPTRALIFKEEAFKEDDFAEEKTELFLEERVSGKFPALPKEDLLESAARSQRRNPAHSTRKIKDEALQSGPLLGTPLEEQKTDPRREAGPRRLAPRRESPQQQQQKQDQEVTAERKPRRPREKRNRRPSGHELAETVQRDRPNPSSTLPEMPPEEDLEIDWSADGVLRRPEPRKPITETDQNEIISPATPEERGSENPKGIQELLSNRRIQIILGVTFVGIAALWVISRLFL